MKWTIEEVIENKQVCLYCVFFNDSLGKIVVALGEQWCTECNLPVLAIEDLPTWQVAHIKHWYLSDDKQHFIAEQPENTDTMINELRQVLMQRIELHEKMASELEEGLNNITE